MLNIHSDQTIYLSRPEVHVPLSKSAKRKAPEKLKATTPSMTVQEYL
jgi:hypothetical protein